jgi:glutaredoxin
VKEYLSLQGVEFIERDIARDEQALAELEELGVMTTPVTVINAEIVVGFDRPRLEHLLSSSMDQL